MAVQQKVQILSNQLMRRLFNVLGEQHKEYIIIINQFTRELRNSCYKYWTARDTVIMGIGALK